MALDPIDRYRAALTHLYGCIGLETHHLDELEKGRIDPAHFQLPDSWIPQHILRVLTARAEVIAEVRQAEQATEDDDTTDGSE